MSEADELVTRAVNAYRAGDSERALGLLEEALAEADEARDEVTARRALAIWAQMLNSLGRPEAALGRYDLALARFPHDGLLWYARGLLLQEQERDEEALASFERATDYEPDDPDGWINRGRLLDDAGRCAEAIDCYDQALSIDDQQELAWTNRGNSLLHLKRFADALESYDRALALDPSSQPAMLGRSSALGALGRIEEANAARPSDPELDPGELREQQRALDGAGERLLVVRYRVGRHSNPELLDAVANGMLELCGELEDEGDTLRNGVSIGFGWSVVTVVERGEQLLLCEPDFTRDPFRELSDQVTLTLQQTVMEQMLHGLTGTEPTPCSYRDTMRVVPGALWERELVMRRLEPEDEFSGWVAGPADESLFDPGLADELDEIPTALLIRHRPHLVKVLSLPPGHTVVFSGHAVVAVYDSTGRELGFDGE